MTIRLAQPKDIPALLGLLEQILSVHHQARPDIFKGSGGKYSKEELKQLMAQDQTPIFVYENADGQILGHLFITIKEVSDNPVLHPIKTSSSRICVSIKQRVDKKIGDQLYQFALRYAKEIGCYNLTLNVWNDNERALRFYQRQGMKPQETVMETIL